jgi:hypothetical protein
MQSGSRQVPMFQRNMLPATLRSLKHGDGSRVPIYLIRCHIPGAHILQLKTLSSTENSENNSNSHAYFQFSVCESMIKYSTLLIMKTLMLLGLIKMYSNETYSKVCFQIPVHFLLRTVWNKWMFFLWLLFNFALEHTIEKVLEKQGWLEPNGTHYLLHANDNLFTGNIDTIKKKTQNTDTCSSLISRNHNKVTRTANKSFQNMTDFMYLGMSVWNRNIYMSNMYKCHMLKQCSLLLWNQD